jgi:hypothetical protein
MRRSFGHGPAPPLGFPDLVAQLGDAGATPIRERFDLEKQNAVLKDIDSQIAQD